MNSALFLDRDGVLNERLVGDYVKSPSELVPVLHLAETMALLSQFFSPIVVVTNQQGIGKGLMTEADLKRVHEALNAEATRLGGRIDGFYHCPHRSDAGCNCRKPGIGMALQAKADFPQIDFQNAWMVGDSVSDMDFAHNAGMHPVFIHGKEEDSEKIKSKTPEHTFENLAAFAQFVKVFWS
ncbi:MAG: HAD family hydrolase [Saprospiraceae bacterium]|nr:HAD family hydrolase [Saprospiraceae bacterium]